MNRSAGERWEAGGTHLQRRTRHARAFRRRGHTSEATVKEVQLHDAACLWPHSGNRAREREYAERKCSYEDQLSGRDGGREPAYLVHEHCRRRRQRCVSQERSGVVFWLRPSVV